MGGGVPLHILHLLARLSRVDPSGLEGAPPQVTVVMGDITTQDVDAIVNAANPQLSNGRGVTGAIHREGGPEILADCVARYHDGIPVGDAGWTTAGRLRARWVIHAVGPNHHAGQTDRRLLTSCYRRSLEVADELGAASVAFPLISSGIYGWPFDDAVAAAVETLRATATTAKEARVVAWDQQSFDAVRSHLGVQPTQS